MSTATLNFAARTCSACHTGTAPLSPDQARAYHTAVPDWELRDGATRLHRRFTFKTFAQAFAFVGKVAAIAEQENHHPDITFGWGYAEVTLFTHTIEGLHENDFIVAAKIDQAISGV